MIEQMVTRVPEAGIVGCHTAGVAMRVPGVELLDARSMDGRLVLDYGFPETGVVVLRSVHRHSERGGHTHRLLGVNEPRDETVIDASKFLSDMERVKP